MSSIEVLAWEVPKKMVRMARAMPSVIRNVFRVLSSLIFHIPKGLSTPNAHRLHGFFLQGELT